MNNLFVILLCAVNLIILAVVLASFFRKLPLASLDNQFNTLKDNLERIERAVKAEISTNREEAGNSLRQSREELNRHLTGFNESFSKQLIELTKLNEQKLNNMRATIEERLKLLQDENGKKLDEMRATVDEKLHTTLEKRLSESFKLVSDRLERVREGLGEMQNLAAGVGDLKKVLTNVKMRGTWGEIQLGNLLEQILTPEQYSKNVATKRGSRDNVEFALRLPGKSDHPVWLPIDSKFPQEDYDRLLTAQEQANLILVEEAGKALENRIKAEAKSIRNKYIDPPYTTDFGILFLPTESLFAEIIRRPGVCEFLQREYRVSIAGPTTLAALLNSLQMGFRTVAIEQRASEVWNLLGAVKTEFGHFGLLLDKTHKKLQEASNTIEDAAKKTRTIEKKLKDVQVLPNQSTAEKLLDDVAETYSVDDSR